jgi:hypothetical protein
VKVTESLDSWTNSSSNRNDHGGKKLAEISGVRTVTSAAFQHEHNHTDGIALLRSLGAKIPLFALIHAVEHVHLETIILLLELGADPEGFPVNRMLEHPMRNASKREKQIIRSYFRQFGYHA